MKKPENLPFKQKRAQLGLLAILTMTIAVPSIAVTQELETTSVDKKEVRDQLRKRKEAQAAAKNWAKRNPERYAKLVPPDASLDPQGVSVEITLHDGTRNTVVLDSLLQTVLGLGYMELKSRDISNLERVYTDLYQILPEHYHANLPSPSSLVGLKPRKVHDALKKIGDRVVRDFDNIRNATSASHIIAGLNQNPIGLCSNEIGWETAGSDSEISARCAIGDYASLGAMRNLDFALKDDLTCVKDQGPSRGTCVAHAVAANVESMIQVEGGVPENLAEQDLYFWGKINTDFGNRYRDGLNPDEVYDELDARDFKIQYESHWNYNRSPIRDANLNANNEFPHSCWGGYIGEMCTDYAFQAEEMLVTPPIHYQYQIPARATTGWEIRDWGNIPDLPGLSDFQIDTAILFLEFEYPVHISFDAAKSTATPDANGYVQYDPTDPSPDATHSVLAVGFIANADLPVGVPLDPDGRGYVIIKNSWGIDYADCGFAYLSTEFLRHWGYAYRYLGKTVTFN